MTEHSSPAKEAVKFPVFYFPWQKRVMASSVLPEELYFLNPGLPLPVGTPEAERIFTPEGFPYGPPSAARCLQDLLAEGELLGENLLSSVNAGSSFPLGLSPLSASEDRSLNAFTRTGAYTSEAETKIKDIAPVSELSREQGQKLLLLSSYLEDSILSAGELALKINENEVKLRNLLANPDEEDSWGSGRDFRPDPSPAANDLLEKALARWPEILRAWLLFLPQEPVFYTTNPNILPGLEASVHPLSAADAGRFFPVSSALGWTFTEVFSEAFKGARLFCGQKV